VAEQRGHFAPTATLVIGIVSGLPQCEQNFAPRKLSPKQDGQEIVASFAPQYWHCVASEETTPPQLGQLREAAGTAKSYLAACGFTLSPALRGTPGRGGWTNPNDEIRIPESNPNDE